MWVKDLWNRILAKFKNEGSGGASEPVMELKPQEAPEPEPERKTSDEMIIEMAQSAAGTDGDEEAVRAAAPQTGSASGTEPEVDAVCEAEPEPDAASEEVPEDDAGAYTDAQADPAAEAESGQEPEFCEELDSWEEPEGGAEEDERKDDEEEC